MAGGRCGQKVSRHREQVGGRRGQEVACSRVACNASIYSLFYVLYTVSVQWQRNCPKIMNIYCFIELIIINDEHNIAE
jgi:hypothetical protein